MSIGSRIKQIRIEKGMTQKKLGELCGMADSAIRRYESDRGNPTEKTLLRIASALDIPLEVLYFDYVDYDTPADWAGISLEEKESYIKRIQDDARKTLELRNELKSKKFCNSVNGKIIISAYFELNDLGQKEAVKRVEELIELKKYQLKKPSQCDEHQGG